MHLSISLVGREKLQEDSKHASEQRRSSSSSARASVQHSSTAARRSTCRLLLPAALVLHHCSLRCTLHCCTHSSHTLPSSSLALRCWPFEIRHSQREANSQREQT